MPRPVDQVTADERGKGRPGLVRLAAPRYPEVFPDTVVRLVDGVRVTVPHPKAGQLHPQAGQVVRNTVRFRDTDTGGHVSVHSTGPAFWNSDGSAVDSDLIVGPGLFVATANAALGFGFRLQADGGFTTTHPQGGKVTVGGIEWLSSAGYQSLVVGGWTVIENRAEGLTAQGTLIVAVKGGLVITELLVTEAKYLTGWRQSVSVEPPALSRGRYEAGYVYYDPPEVDADTVWPLRVGL